jgi:hypothetical protein
MIMGTGYLGPSEQKRDNSKPSSLTFSVNNSEDFFIPSLKDEPISEWRCDA